MDFEGLLPTLLINKTLSEIHFDRSNCPIEAIFHRMVKYDTYYVLTKLQDILLKTF